MFQVEFTGKRLTFWRSFLQFHGVAGAEPRQQVDQSGQSRPRRSRRPGTAESNSRRYKIRSLPSHSQVIGNPVHYWRIDCCIPWNKTRDVLFVCFLSETNAPTADGSLDWNVPLEWSVPVSTAAPLFVQVRTNVKSQTGQRHTTLLANQRTRCGSRVKWVAGSKRSCGTRANRTTPAAKKNTKQTRTVPKSFQSNEEISGGRSSLFF